MFYWDIIFFFGMKRMDKVKELKFKWVKIKVFILLVFVKIYNSWLSMDVNFVVMIWNVILFCVGCFCFILGLWFFKIVFIVYCEIYY